MSDPQSQSIIDALASDHRAIAEQLDAAATEKDPREAAVAREQLVMMLVRHFVAEEQYFYPTVRESLDGGDALAHEGLAADRSCENQLKRLEDDDLSLGQLAETLEAVRTAFATHVERQDPQLDALATGVPAERLVELGADVRGAEELAPTRPRSFVPSSVPANKFVSLVGGYIDKVRDHYSHRGVDPEEVDEV